MGEWFGSTWGSVASRSRWNSIVIKDVFFTKLFKKCFKFWRSLTLHSEKIQYKMCILFKLVWTKIKLFDCTVFLTNRDYGFTVIGHEAFLSQYVQRRMKELRNPSTPGLFSIRLSRLNEIQEEKADIIPYLAWMDWWLAYIWCQTCDKHKSNGE